MTIVEALKKYKDIEAELLLEHVLKQSKEFLYLFPDKKLTELQRKKFILLANYRKHGLPMAYVLGYKYFFGLKFEVTKDVLIPRPETEWLVEQTLIIAKTKLLESLSNPKRKKIKILDLATGSGCIGISLAANLPSVSYAITASDVSDKALKVAKSNAKLNKVSVKFIKSNLFSNIKDRFDIIVTNPPYVPLTDYKKFYKNLKHEPKLALTDGGDDFKLIKKLLADYSQYLNPGGVILLEVDPKFIKQNKQKSWKIVKDLHKLDRFIVIERP